MSVNSKIIDALSPLDGDPVVPDIYEGTAEKYYTFNYDTLPVAFGSNNPTFERYLVQVHLICPRGFNSLAQRQQTKQALRKAGFTWPTEIDAFLESQSGAEDRQHFVFECETREAVTLNAEP